jgi:AcrR family transcriptional regulator
MALDMALDTKRAYVSPLRDGQSEATRVRIVEAVARVLARGIVELSVPAVAKEAGVSVATVYRHFPTKTDLVSGLTEHVAGLVGTRMEDINIVSLNDMEAKGRDIHQKLAQLDPALRLAMASPQANQLRRETRKKRLAANERMLAPYIRHLSHRERRRVRDLCVVLMSSATANAFDMLVGSSPEETADTLTWGLRRIIGTDGQRRRR